MASITPIYGTDSLSSSRIVINNNFESVKTELADIASLLNTNNQTLVLTGAITSSGISLVNGGSSLFTVTTTEIVSTLEHSFEADVKFEAGVISSVYGNIAAPATVLPTAGNWDHETYFMQTGTYSLTTAHEGQNVTLVAADGDVTLTFAEISGESVDVVISLGTTLSLRFLGSLWYVISKN